MEGFRAIFQGVDDPRRINATKHDLIEMLVIALLTTLSGKSSCNSFAWYAKYNCEFLSEFMALKGGPPSHDAFSDLSDALDPRQLAAAMTKFANALFFLRRRPILCYRNALGIPAAEQRQQTAMRFFGFEEPASASPSCDGRTRLLHSMQQLLLLACRARRDKPANHIPTDMKRTAHSWSNSFSALNAPKLP